MHILSDSQFQYTSHQNLCNTLYFRLLIFLQEFERNKTSDLWPSGRRRPVGKRGVTGSIIFPAKTYIFILNFSLISRVSHLGRAMVNKIKRDHSPVVNAVLDPKMRFIIRGIYILITVVYSFNKSLINISCQ